MQNQYKKICFYISAEQIGYKRIWNINNNFKNYDIELEKYLKNKQYKNI